MQVNTKCLSVRALGVALFTLALAASSAWAYTTEPGWVTNNYFAADATSGDKVTLNGDWTLNEPNVVSSKFAIDSTQSVFSVTSIKTNDFRKIIQIDAAMDISDYYYADDLSTDAPNAIAGISLTTNEQAASSVAWKVLVSGSSWDTVVSGPDTALGSYTVRAELDYTTAATPLVRYSVKKSGSDAYTVLKNGDTEWFSAKASAPSVSNVCFCGQANLSTLSSKLGTTAAAEVNEKDYNTVLEAIAVAKAKDNTIVLYKNCSVSTRDLKGNLEGTTYTFNSNDKTLTVTQGSWTVADEKGVDATFENGQLVVESAKGFAAKIGDGDSAPAYTKLQYAFDAVGSNQKIDVMKKLTESTVTTASGVTLDLGGYALTKGSSEKPILTIGSSGVSGAGLVITNGYIEGAPTGYAAVSALNGATVTLDDVAVTNDAGSAKAISAAGGSTVTINNGLYTGDFVATDDNTKIKILGGYYLANNTQAMTMPNGKIVATGGKFTDVSSNALESASGIADGYKLAVLAVPFTTNGFTITYEVMTNITQSGSSDPVPTKVWTVEESGTTAEKVVGGVQIPDQWVTDNVDGADNAAKQTDLNTTVDYAGGNKVKKWEAYVLGIPAKNAGTHADEGPVVKGVQDTNTDKISFRIMSPEAIQAKESGCDVKFSVTPYTNPGLTEQATGDAESAKADYTDAVELPTPSSGVRYYKLKMYISPKD